MSNELRIENKEYDGEFIAIGSSEKKIPCPIFVAVHESGTTAEQFLSKADAKRLGEFLIKLSQQ